MQMKRMGRAIACTFRPFGKTMSAVFFTYLMLSVALPYGAPGWQKGLAVVNGLLFFTLTGGTVVAVLRAVDEFERLLLVRAFGSATLAVMGFACVWGHVEMSAPGTLPHVPLLVLPVALVVLGSVLKVLIFRRHRPLPESGLGAQ